jgi:catechol-2,3-dioxygenase
MARTKLSAINLLLVVMAMVNLGLGHLVAQASAAGTAPVDNPLQLTSDHVTLSVADIDKEAAWYHDVLGFKEYKRGGHGTNTLDCHLNIPGVYRIDLFQQQGSARHTTPGSGFREQGYTHIVFKTAINLDTVNQQLIAKNATVVADKDKNGSVTNILVRDPEGNEIEIQH